jgi:hypothetical protein
MPQMAWLFSISVQSAMTGQESSGQRALPRADFFGEGPTAQVVGKSDLGNQKW